MTDEFRREARDFLAGWLGDEGVDDGSEWWAELAEYVEALPLSDLRLDDAALAVLPLFEDEDGRIEAVIYPLGEACMFVDEVGPSGDPSTFFSGFVQALLADLAMWKQALRECGDGARWPASGMPWSRGRRHALAKATRDRE